METRAFAPNYTPTTTAVNTAGGQAAAVQGSLQTSVTVAASTAAAASGPIGGGGAYSPLVQIRIANLTNGWAFVNFGNLQIAVVTAATVANGYPVAPGSVEIVTVASEVNGASVILSSGATSGSVIFTRGEGL